MRHRKRKICVVVASRANYARIKYLMVAIKKSKNLELQLIVGASALLYKYGKVVDVIKKDGFKPNFIIHYQVDGENLVTQAKSTGMGIIELSTAFQAIKPDVVVTVADRFETMATAVAASYLNIPLAHVQGGEVSGNIDDSVRHAITKLSHIHYPATKESAKRLLNLGEEKWRVFHSGCPSLDIIKNLELNVPKKKFFYNKGTGKIFNPEEPYVIILQHPVTTSFGEGSEQILETLEALKNLKINKLLLWPNADAGSDDISKVIREFQNQNAELNFSYHINFEPEIFVRLIANAKCLIGNSSSFIREGSFLGIPAVIIGDRQYGREHAKNVIFSNYSRNEILKKVQNQIKRGKYPSSKIFGDGSAGKKIANHLEQIKLKIKKKLTY